MGWKFKDLFSRQPSPAPPEAVQSIPAQPSADTWFQRGNAHASQQQWQPALECYREAVRVDPKHADAHAFIGNVLRALRQNDEALVAYGRAIAVNPAHAAAHYNRGVLLQQAGQVRAALESYTAAVVANPAFAEAHLQRGILQQQLNELAAAEASYQQATALKPDYALRADLARVFSNRAQAQAKLGLLAEAHASHDQAVSLDPRDGAIHFNRGGFLSERKEWPGAIESYQAAIALDSRYADAHCNLGHAQQEAGQGDAALESYSQALGINPELPAAFYNRGNLFRSRQQFAQAIQEYRRAIALAPHLAEAHFNSAQLVLLQGDLAAGWPEYEWRQLTAEALAVPARKLPQPAWFGDQPIQGKQIFLHAEQGLGDTIQFCRYVSLVAGLGARVTLEIQPSLGDLLANLEGVSQLVFPGGPVPVADYQCSLLSLPGAFKTTLQTIPRQVPYLRADPHKVARWHEILGPRTRPRVGLAWSGNPNNSNDLNRSVDLARWLTFLPDECEYFCLQKGIRDADRRALNSCGKFTPVESHNENFTDTAALMEILDLVVSVDTSIAHLGGALGRTTWILLPFQPDWRWMLERRDTPWYPTASLYRQSAVGDWDGVMARVNQDLLSL